MPTRRHLLFAGATGLAVLATLSSVGRRALVGAREHERQHGQDARAQDREHAAEVGKDDEQHGAFSSRSGVGPDQAAAGWKASARPFMQ